MKKLNQNPFSNGSEEMMFECQCCSDCIKYSYMRKDGTFTNADNKNIPNRCSIQRDIITRGVCDEPINERTIKVCNDFTMHGIICPYRKTERKRYSKKYKGQMALFDKP